MPKPKTDVLQGTLDLLVLKSLVVAGPLHGYAITQHIRRVSVDLLRVEEGSLYPALLRMQQEGWLQSSWGTTEKNRQTQNNTITAAGRKQLAHEDESWLK